MQLRRIMQHRLLWFRDDLVNDNSAASAALNCADTRISAVFLTADDEWEPFVMQESVNAPSNCL